MFTDKAQDVVDLAKDLACATGAVELALAPVIAAVLESRSAKGYVARAVRLTPEEVEARRPAFPPPVACPGKLPLAEETKDLLALARDFANEVPDPQHSGAIDVRHLACALGASEEACRHFKVLPMARNVALAMLASWYQEEGPSIGLDKLALGRAEMQAAMFDKVFGQDHAVLAFVEGLFNAEVLAASDVERRAPRAVFVFAGPPGVGKTLLAETGAIHMGRPFKRFDMTSYASYLQIDGLAGSEPMYKGARPGALTSFVEKNPNAVLLFDEIEKAHPLVIQLFMQILDNGLLEDRFMERHIAFRDTTVIFTTNAGRKLYDRTDGTGVLPANDAFHRQTILDALESETHPMTRDAVFPPALCSRMATGYPVLFNHLRVNELERVVNAELKRVAGLFDKQYEKVLEFDELLALCIVLREGTRADARVLRAQAEAFVKREIFQICELYQTARLEQVLETVDRLRFGVDAAARDKDPEVKLLFESPDEPTVLLIADESLCALFREHLPGFQWRTAQEPEDALEILATQDVRVVLVDIWLGRFTLPGASRSLEFDHVPLASSSLDHGQEILHRIRTRLPDTPVYLLSILTQNADRLEALSVANELYMACVRGGGARGLVECRFVDATVAGWAERRDALKTALALLCRNLHREAMADHMGRERRVLAFDTVPRVTQPREISTSLTHLRFARAMASRDVGEVLSDVERPKTRFADVIGADAAKEELGFFVEFLKNPKRYAALGLKPPKGVLLHGPPGTGKTMLARAMAGESNVAFIAVAATSFVTIWQGSGPQSVRDLFARARRYAPAIIFIDELDAIGRARHGAIGAGRAEENTLNALLAEMDGFTSPSVNRPIFILAATNFPISAGESGAKVMDPALVRRFSRTILVDLPEKAARATYLTKRLAGRKGCTVDAATIELLALRSTGMSIANLELVIEHAARASARLLKELDNATMLDAFEKELFGEANEKREESLRLRTARHEAGHTILYWLGGWWPSYVTVVSRGEHYGYTQASDQLEKGGVQTRAKLLAMVRSALGGRAAELLYYGPEDGLTTGASSDLQHASDLARAMICEYGMDESGELLVTPGLVRSPAGLASPLYQKVEAAAQIVLRREMEASLAALNEHRAKLDALAAALVEKERLTGDEVKAILGERP